MLERFTSAEKAPSDNMALRSPLKGEPFGTNSKVNPSTS